MLFADDFDEDSVGEGGVAEDVDDAVFGEAAEHGVGLGIRVGRGFGFDGVGAGYECRSASVRDRRVGSKGLWRTRICGWNCD